MMWFVLFLTVFHSFLLVTNQTTHEYLKKLWKDPPSNPFSYRNFLKNLIAVMFKRAFPKYFDMYRQIDSAFDTVSISPSHHAMFHDVQIKPNLYLSKTDGKNSPNSLEKLNDKSHDQSDEIVVPENI